MALITLISCVEPTPFYKPAEKESNPVYQSTVSLASSSQIITSEINTNIYVTINISPAASVPITIGYTTSDVTAVAWEDYIPTVGTITIPAGYSFYTVAIPMLDDNLYELDESFNFSITYVSGVLFGSPSIQNITINTNDALYIPEANFTEPIVSVIEAATTLTATVTLDSASGIDTSITLNFSGSATDGGGDYLSTITELFFPAGETSQTFTIDILNDFLTETDENIIISLNSTANITLGNNATKTITIIDNQPRPALTISATDVIDESDATEYLVTITLDTPFPLDISASISLTWSEATLTNDFLISSQDVLITAGNVTTTISFSIVDDAINEIDENIVFTLTNYHPLTDAGGSIFSATTSIVDDDVAPLVAFTSTSQVANETDGILSVIISLNAVSGQTVTVPVTLAAASTATYGASEDHLFTNTSLEFLAGEVTKTITFAINDDSLYELDETIILALGVPTNATLGTNASHSITLVNDEIMPTMSFSISETASYENSTDTYIATIIISPASEVTISASLDFTGSLATLGSDFDFSTTDLIFTSGATTQTVTFTLTNDDGFELNETIVISATDLINATLGTTQTFTIINDDPVPVLTISATDQVLEDDAGPHLITVTLSSTSYLDTNLNITLSGTATDTVDFTIATTSFTMISGTTTATTDLTILEDTIYEGNESILLTISGAIYATNGATHSLTIIENDGAPTISVSSPATINENDTYFDLLITLSASTQLNVTADINYVGSANHPLDYYFSPAIPAVSITAGSTSQVVTVYIENDANYEASETIFLSAINIQNATEGTTNTTTSILDDDTIPALSITTTTASFSESGGTYELIVQSNVLSYQTMTATLNATGTAIVNEDYTLNATAVSIAPGNNTATLSITIINDSTDETSESVNFYLTNLANATFTGTTYTTIEDDDLPPTTSITQISSVIEPINTIFTVSLTLSSTTAYTVTGSFALTGSATENSDYTFGTKNILIAPGSLTGTSTFQVINDSLDEDNETIIINAINLNYATPGTGYTTTIIDDDALPIVNLSAPSPVSENIGSYNVTVTLNATSGKTVTGSFQAGGSATNVTDYALSATTFSITAGTRTDTLNISIVNDTVDEDNETLSISSYNIVNGTNGVTNTVTTTIVDDDPLPNIAFSSALLSFPESAGEVFITFMLDRLSSKTVSSNFVISGSTNSSDHEAVNGIIIIPPGNITGQYSFNILEDYITEGDETIVFTAVNPTNATLGTPNPLTVTITDNDTTTMALGADHSCVLINGKIKCWGSNLYGQLGFDTISKGFGTNYGDNPSESVTTTITALFDYLDLGTDFIATTLVAGGNHNCVLNPNSEIKCWGDNRFGQLGFPDPEWGPSTNIAMGDDLPYVYMDNGAKLTAVKLALGERHTCALSTDGLVYCFGANNSGQLGNGSIDNIGDDEAVSSTPVTLPTTALDITAGAFHTCAVLSNNQTTCWGNGFYGQLGDDNNLPIVTTASTSITWTPPTLGTIEQINSTGFFNCIYFSNNFIKCFGFNSNGELGLGDNNHRGDSAGEMALLPNVVIPGTGLASKIVTGIYHTCILSGRTPYCFGDNSFGQLGQNSTADHNLSSTAAATIGLSGTVLDIEAGYYHNCVLLGTKSVKCWGQNSSGQLGALDFSDKGTLNIYPNRIEDSPLLIFP